MNKTTCYIVNFYFGDRRRVPNSYNEDRLIFLKTQIETLRKYKNKLSKIVFNFNLEIEHYSIFNKALKIIPNEINGSKIDIKIKEDTSYMSYESFAECYDEYKDQYDYYFFNEDDYYFVKDDWDTYLINKIDSYDDCGALCCCIKEPESMYDYKKHSGSGIFSSNNSLRKVYNKFGGLPYKNETKGYYSTAENSQIDMSFCFIEVGLNLYDIRDEFMFPFAINHGDNDIWLLYNWNEDILIVPHIYYESIILALYSHNHWISFDLQFTKDYKLSNTNVAKYLYKNKINYFEYNENNLKKDLILVTAYTPDDIRKKYLEDLLLSIDKDKFDIMISSHSNISEKSLNMCDYFIYDKNNYILYDHKHKVKNFFKTSSMELYTTEWSDFNHMIAAGTLIFNGLCYARDMKYEKVHYIEYDSLIINDIELLENSKLLDDYSMVYYKLLFEYDYVLYSLFSLNLNKINDKWFDNSIQNFEKFINNSNIRTLESYNTILKDLNEIPSYEKDLNNMSNNIKTNLHTSFYPNFSLPVRKEDKIFIFLQNETGEEIDCVVKINEKEELYFRNENIGTWTLNEICDYDILVKLKIEDRKSKIIKQYDFEKIDKFDFFESNKISFH